MIPDDTPYGRDNCGIAAVAMLAKVSYAEAEAMFLEYCARRDITSVWDRIIVMHKLGLRVTEEWHYRVKPTLFGWYRKEYDPAYDYQVTVTGHALAVRKHKVFDPTFREGWPLKDCPYKRKHVSSTIRLGEVQ